MTKKNYILVDRYDFDQKVKEPLYCPKCGKKCLPTPTGKFDSSSGKPLYYLRCPNKFGGGEHEPLSGLSVPFLEFLPGLLGKIFQ